MKNKIIIIAGPTACGKTAISLKIAHEIDGEIISADSMQIYKEMDIGTAKIQKCEMESIPHHLLNIVFPNEKYSVANYQEDAFNIINEIHKRGKIPVVVGGTGLYIHSLICDVDFTHTSSNNSFRNEMALLSNEELYKMLIKADPCSAKRIHINDKKRIIRRLEIINDGGDAEKKSFDFRRPNTNYDFINICLTMPRDILYNRINERVDIMIKNGLVAEVKSLYKKYSMKCSSMLAIGYKEIINAINGNISIDQAIADIKQNTRRYAKRQMTWFKREANFKWFDIADYSVYDNLLSDIINFIKEKL